MGGKVDAFFIFFQTGVSKWLFGGARRRRIAEHTHHSELPTANDAAALHGNVSHKIYSPT